MKPLKLLEKIIKMHEAIFLAYTRMDLITKETYKKWCRINSRSEWHLMVKRKEERRKIKLCKFTSYYKNTIQTKKIKNTN